MTLMRKQGLKYWFSLGVFVAGTVSASFISVVSAAPTGGGIDYFTNLNNGFYAGIFLRDCLSQSKNTTVGNPTNYQYLLTGSTGSNHDVYIGRFMKPDDGIAKCQDAATVQAAISNFGFSDGAAFLTGVGYQATQQQTTGPDPSCTSPVSGGCPNITTTITVYKIGDINTAIGAINKKIGDYEQTPAAQFFAYDTIFSSRCSVSETITGKGTKASLTKVIEDTANPGTYTTQSVDVEFASTTTNTGNLGNDSYTYDTATTPITKYDYNRSQPYTGLDTTCAKLLTLRNNLAADMAKFNNAHPDKAILSDAAQRNTTPIGDSNTGATCVGGALGWLLCPIVTIMDNLNKSMANYIESMLKVDMMTNDNSRPALQSIWSMLVGIANLLLVVAFLIVIFSQATSIGLSAYGIKKMLPRIIAAAILINLSFFVCGVLVDIFNIVGGAVKDIIGVGIQAVKAPSTATLNTSDPLVSFAAWVTVLSGVLVTLTVAAFTGLIAFVLPVIATGTLATLGFFVAIALRQVLIVLLIVVSPIAIAAMILPNTESLFKKWMSGFIKLLAMYPIVIAIMYGCTLVAKIILAGT